MWILYFLKQRSGWSQYITIYSSVYLQHAVQATDRDTHKLQYVKTPRKFLVNKAVLLMSFSTQSIKTVVSYLTSNPRTSRIRQFYHIKLVSALKVLIDWDEKWQNCLCQSVNVQAESFTALSEYTLSTVKKKKKKKASGRKSCRDSTMCYLSAAGSGSQSVFWWTSNSRRNELWTDRQAAEFIHLLR